MELENIVSEEISSNDKKEKLWTSNFVLLWQGQLVSALGDRMYEIALGFWILAVTGSTALMGTLMAASMIPRIVISPAAGVIVDRTDRKKIIVMMDLIRGIFITFIGVAAIFGFIQVWMVFAAGIALGTCDAFFNPSVSSSIPDLVPKSKLIKANSAFSMIYSGSNIVGSSIGGVIYNIIGAPVMFLADGLSFLFSSFVSLFIKIPKVEKHMSEQKHFKQDFKEGLSFVWKFKGLKYLICIASVINFFANMGIILFLPFFQKTETLGPVKYGIAMSALTAGMFAGMLFTSIVNIPYNRRALIFTASSIISFSGFALIILIPNFIAMLAVIFICGAFNAVINSFINASVQLTVPQEMRGKVFSLMGTVTMGLTPLGMALGGILAELISIKIIITSSFLITIVITIIFIFIKSFKRFINFNPDEETLEDIM